jgi:LmbE family N-acetylglucosaminyl deacetylase
MSDAVLAIAAHPDDIEFQMAGTLLLLARAGWRVHGFNIATGSCGTTRLGRNEIVRIRSEEARRSVEGVLGGTLHPPVVDDLLIFYDQPLLAKVSAVFRQVNPRILLLHSPEDYMEDHMNASRLGVTAAFARGMPNFATDPPTPPLAGPVAVYHALPTGLKDPLRRPVRPHLYVDVTDVMDTKREALACHRSQRNWLDESQAMDDYLRTLDERAAAIGEMSGRFAMAEAWRRHAALGFSEPDYDPLSDSLGEVVLPCDDKQDRI